MHSERPSSILSHSKKQNLFQTFLMAESWSTWQRANLILAIYIVNAVNRHDAKFGEKSDRRLPDDPLASASAMYFWARKLFFHLWSTLDFNALPDKKYLFGCLSPLESLQYDFKAFQLTRIDSVRSCESR